MLLKIKNIYFPILPRHYDQAEVVSSSFPPLGECVVGARFLWLFTNVAF